jgi:hypothetical protein
MEQASKTFPNPAMPPGVTKNDLNGSSIYYTQFKFKVPSLANDYLITSTPISKEDLFEPIPKHSKG